MGIGKYVRSRRLKAGISFRELSRRSGLTSTTIFNIESGKSEPKFSAVERLAQAFGQSTVAFLRGYYSD